MLRYALMLVALLPVTGCVVYTRPGDPSEFDEPAANYNGWTKLGSRLVTGKGDRDTVHVGRIEGKFAKLKFKVRHSAMRMHDVVVVFANGTRYSPQTRTVFDKNTTSNVFDLPGEQRTIDRIEFRYSDLPGGGSAEVEVWGR